MVESYLTAQEQHVEVDGKKSCPWKNVGRGVSQGSHLAGTAYNIATLGHTDPSRLDISTRYSDDDSEICIGSNAEELQKEILRALTDKKSKVDRTGLTLQPKKTKILQVNCKIDAVVFDGAVIHPKKTIKLLGSWLMFNLKSQTHVDNLIPKLRYATAKIRSTGIAPAKMKLPLYYAWAQSAVLYNAAAYLLDTTQKQKKRIQVSLNHALRAAVNAPLKSKDSAGNLRYLSATKLRKKYGVPSVEQLEKFITTKWTLKIKEHLRELQQAQTEQERIVTRNIHRLRPPNIRGPRNISIIPKCIKLWDDVPDIIKQETNQAKAKRKIKNWIFNRGRPPENVGLLQQ